MAEANDAFEREYVQAEYEQKIGKLIRNFCATARQNNREDLRTWTEATRTLRREDHYLLVLIDAGEGSPGVSWGRFLKLSAIAFVIACVILAIGSLFIRR